MDEFYQVQYGDHICEIAKKYNTTCEKIIKLNELTNIDYIKEGDILRIR